MYTHHGVRLPEEYGKVLSNLWKPEWLLSEKNAEVRRVLIQGIGCERICSELNAVSIDKWREYELVKITDEADVEPIHLLKMTCPSTAHIHVHWMPPTIQKAREAATWMNRGVDPCEFAKET
jgi:hypothetical protein